MSCLIARGVRTRALGGADVRLAAPRTYRFMQRGLYGKGRKEPLSGRSEDRRRSGELGSCDGNESGRPIAGLVWRWADDQPQGRDRPVPSQSRSCRFLSSEHWARGLGLKSLFGTTKTEASCGGGWPGATLEGLASRTGTCTGRHDTERTRHPPGGMSLLQFRRSLGLAV